MINIDQDNTLLKEGAWAEYGGSEFLIIHVSDLSFQRAVQRRQAPHRRKIEAGTLDPETSRNLMCRAMAEAMVRDWRNVVNAKKEQVPFDEELCYKLLIRDPDLRDFISEFSLNMDNYRAEMIEEVGKS